jgi:hypothetical protein
MFFFKKVLPILLLAVFLGASVHAYEAVNGPTGVLAYDKEKAFEGYTLFAPMLGSTTTYLIDNEGNVVHTWEGDHPPGL